MNSIFARQVDIAKLLLAAVFSVLFLWPSMMLAADIIQGVEVTPASEKQKLVADDKNKRWGSYQRKAKSIPEQTLNYSTTSNTEGMQNDYWIADEKQKCVLTNVRVNYFSTNGTEKVIDIRKFNETAFRIRRNLKYLSPTSARPVAVFTFGDDNHSFDKIFLPVPLGEPEPLMERLVKAWGLTFQECPGKKSAF